MGPCISSILSAAARPPGKKHSHHREQGRDSRFAKFIKVQEKRETVEEVGTLYERERLLEADVTSVPESRMVFTKSRFARLKSWLFGAKGNAKAKAKAKNQKKKQNERKKGKKKKKMKKKKRQTEGVKEPNKTIRKGEKY